MEFIVLHQSWFLKTWTNVKNGWGVIEEFCIIFVKSKNIQNFKKKFKFVLLTQKCECKRGYSRPTGHSLYVPMLKNVIVKYKTIMHQQVNHQHTVVNINVITSKWGYSTSASYYTVIWLEKKVKNRNKL